MHKYKQKDMNLNRGPFGKRGRKGKQRDGQGRVM
jgi:hypothetical protein